MDWSLVLFFLKWLLLGMVYVFLGVLLLGVTRELRQRVPHTPTAVGGVSIGRFRVIQPGSDPGLALGSVIPLRPESQIGAKRGNTIVLRDRFISGNHARVRWDGVSWWIEDLNSTNGTLVNQTRIPSGAAEPLPYGSVVQLGDVIFELIE